MNKDIWYVHSIPEEEFYYNLQTVISFDSVMKTSSDYTIHHQERGYGFLQNTDPSIVMFPAHCGLYLVQTEFVQKKDTMHLSIYNIPAHQSFQIDTVLFQKGDFMIDLQASDLLGDFEFVENKGYFLIPSSYIKPIARKED